MPFECLILFDDDQLWGNLSYFRMDAAQRILDISSHASGLVDGVHIQLAQDLLEVLDFLEDLQKQQRRCSVMAETSGPFMVMWAASVLPVACSRS